MVSFLKKLVRTTFLGSLQIISDFCLNFVTSALPLDAEVIAIRGLNVVVLFDSVSCVASDSADCSVLTEHIV